MESKSAQTGVGGAPSKMEEQWLQFALRQAARAAPHPAPASHQHAGAAAAYCLRLAFLECWPLFQAEDHNYDVRLGVTLFDEASGCFFGPTAHSAAVEYDMKRSKGRRGFHVNLGCSFFLHTRAAVTSSAGAADSSACGSTNSGGGLLAVVEVVLVDRSTDGVARAEYSAGWCAVPLELPLAGATMLGSGGSHGMAAAAQRAAANAAHSASPDKVPGLAGSGPFCCLHPGWPGAAENPVPLAGSGAAAPLQDGIMAAQLGTGGHLCVPVFVGSPRYLLLLQLLPLQRRLPPEKLLADGAASRLHYQFELCPEAAGWAPLVPENFLLSCRDVVPGVQRRRRVQAAAGSGSSGTGWTPTLGVLDIFTVLTPPLLHDVHAVVLSGLSMHLPDGFLEVVRKQAATMWRQAHGAPLTAGNASGDGGVSMHSRGRGILPLAELQRSLALRVSVHNGRRFVGPPVLCGVAALEPIEGCRGEHRLELDRDAQLAWLPADRFVAVVLELLLQQTRRQQASSGGGGGGEAGQAGDVILGWAAVMPFHLNSECGGCRLSVAEGLRQAVLRSGPGCWLRHTPVLDWRRLIERTNRSSPAAPTINCVLQPVPGQGVWPPPSVTLPPCVLTAANPRSDRVAAALLLKRSKEEWEQLQAACAASEVETLLSAHSAQQRQQQQQWGPGLRSNGAAVAVVGGGSRVAPGCAWQIGTHFTPSGTEKLFQLPSIHTKPQQPAAQRGEEEAAALYSGSPTAKLALRRGTVAFCKGTSAVDAAVEAAAAATPAPLELSRCQVSSLLSAELADEMATFEVALQLLAFEADTAGAGSGDAELPSRLHFTFRFFSAQHPTITTPVHLQPAPASCAPGCPQLFALLPGAAAGSGSRCSSSGGGSGSSAQSQLPAPALPLILLDAAMLRQQLQQLVEQGAPQAAVASLVWQQRLRAARYLAERRLQVDVWDSESMLQVGTLSVPLHGLLRQSQSAVHTVLRVAVQDQGHAVMRQGGAAGSTRLCSAPLQGCFVLRLACQGKPLKLPGLDGSGGGAGWTASLLKQDGRHVVLRAAPALEEQGSPTVTELARRQGLPPASPTGRLRDELLGRAASKVQRLLHFQSLAAPANGPHCGGSTPGSPMRRAGAARQADAQQELGAASVSCLVEREVLGEVAAARERCKRDTILRQLQAHLPACVVLCAAPGDAVPFERQFVNSSSQGAWFEVSIDSNAAGHGSETALSLVADEAEWQALAPATSLAAPLAQGRSSSSASARPVGAARFQLAPHEACLLRFQLVRSLQHADTAERQQQPAGGDGTMEWHGISVRHMDASLEPANATCNPEVAATIQVVTALLPTSVDRTLRLYCPAASGTSIHTVQLASLQGSARLLEAGSLTCSSTIPGVAAVVQGGCMQLSCVAPPAHTACRFLLTIHGGSSRCHKGCPLEVWEVFVHGLPVVRLAASVGSTASASCQLPAFGLPGCNSGSAASDGQAAQAQLACHWRGCSSGELQADVAAGLAGERSRLALRFLPAAVGQRELLLSVAGVELQLAQLDSSSTEISRTFEVQLKPGQVLSKKVRYRSPYPQPRRFMVRSMAPALLRVAQPCAAFELEGSGIASIKMTLDASNLAAAAGGVAGRAAAGQEQGGDGGTVQHEALVVVESVAVAGGGRGAGGSKVEEVFQVLLHMV